MDSLTIGLIIGIAIMLAVFFVVGMSLKLIRYWAQKKLDEISG